MVVGGSAGDATQTGMRPLASLALAPHGADPLPCTLTPTPLETAEAQIPHPD